VRPFLREFLSDPRVLDMPGWTRSLLLNTVILPFRPAKAARAYAKIWTEEGSPLLVHGRNLAAALRARLGEETPVALGMRYGTPSLRDGLAELVDAGVSEVVAFSLFPHYASSSWGSAIAKLGEEVGRFNVTPYLTCLPVYYDHPAFVRALAAVSGPSLEAPYDKLLLSYHGLPERHVRASDASGTHCLASADCCEAIIPANRACYRAQCHATTRALTAELGLSADKVETAFQSRLGRTPWIRPFTDERLTALPKEGVKRLVVAVPSFAADCLETLEEIGIRGRADFLAAGGEELTLVPCLNSHAAWVEAILEILAEQTHLVARG
jgi:ferrochelatase